MTDDDDDPCQRHCLRFAFVPGELGVLPFPVMILTGQKKLFYFIA
jgi:hypothetical protein